MIERIFLLFIERNCFSVSLPEIYQGDCKSHATNGTHRSRHRIIKFEPIKIRIKELLADQYQYRTRISDGVDHCNKESHISLYPETRDETVKENSLETKIRKIKAKTAPMMTITNKADNTFI